MCEISSCKNEKEFEVTVKNGDETLGKLKLCEDCKNMYQRRENVFKFEVKKI